MIGFGRELVRVLELLSQLAMRVYMMAVRKEGTVLMMM
jgi:hypothetical protein